MAVDTKSMPIQEILSAEQINKKEISLDSTINNHDSKDKGFLFVHLLLIQY